MNDSKYNSSDYEDAHKNDKSQSIELVIQWSRIFHQHRIMMSTAFLWNWFDAHLRVTWMESSSSDAFLIPRTKHNHSSHIK